MYTHTSKALVKIKLIDLVSLFLSDDKPVLRGDRKWADNLRVVF